MKKIINTWIICLLPLFIWAKNPIIPNKGANDPHIRIIDGKAYLSASHDKSAENDKFIMEDWWLWSSTDLVNWEIEYILKPEETYINTSFQGCWATDITKRNNKYYWYFSERNHQSGVMVADHPKGPWVDPLGKPLLAEPLTPTHEYDMGIVEDSNGEFYIVFGVWDYYIARLNEDMVSLAEEPRLITIKNPHGPYNQDGKNLKKPTDDKPFLHLHQGKYYLSWGCFYAMSDNLYGPYEYKGSIIEQESFAPGYDAPTWPSGFKQGRHGSFFEWHNQTYFAYCDISQTNNRYFRDTFISYVHYKANGEMSIIQVDGIGVGEYDGTKKIEAENYFKAEGISKKLIENNRFAISEISNNDCLTFNNIHGLSSANSIELTAKVLAGTNIEIRKNNRNGELITTVELKTCNSFEAQTFNLPQLQETENLCFVFHVKNNKKVEWDSFKFN